MSTPIPADVRPEYPRPDFDRSHSWLSCNGRWDFAATGSALRTPGTDPVDPVWDRQIVVPFSWDCAASEVNLAWLDEGWYRRTMALPAGWRSPYQRIVLHFGAVHHRATVWIDGSEVGGHIGGYLPFEIDITEAVHADSMEIVVRVQAPVDKREIAHGKQRSIPRDDYDDCAFAPSSGIWQSVWLEKRPATYLSALRLRPSDDLDAIEIEVEIGGDATEASVELTVLETGEQRSMSLAGSTVRARLPIADARLWSPEDPQLYHVRAVLTTPVGQDVVTSYTGLRRIEISGNELRLNGERLYVRGVLDQGYWPGTGITAPDDASFVTDLELARRAGFNLVRKHLKTEDPRFLYHADRMGLLVWAEPASTGRFTPAAVAAFETQIAPMVARDGNHPCIVIWGLYNEEWGLDWDVPGDIAKQAAVRRAYRQLKALDPSRPVVDNSGWAHLETDLLDWHIYSSDPNDWRRIVQGIADGTQTRFPVHIAPDVVVHKSMMAGDVPVPGVPNLNSEFGGGFTSAQRGWNLRWQTQEFRRHSQLSGYVYTELYDIEHEMAGIYSQDRKTKELNGVDPELDNAETTLVLNVAPIEPGRDLEAADDFELGLQVSHHGRLPLEADLTAHWLPAMAPLTRDAATQLVAAGTALTSTPVSVKPYLLSEEFTLRLLMPEVPAARLALVVSEGGRVVAASTLDVVRE